MVKQPNFVKLLVTGKGVLTNSRRIVSYCDKVTKLVKATQLVKVTKLVKETKLLDKVTNYLR